MECFTIAALFCTALHNMQCTYYTSTQKVQLFGYQMVSKFKPANLKGSPWSEESPQAGVDLGGWTLLTFCHSWKERVAVWSIFCLKFYWGVALVAVACGGIVVFLQKNYLCFSRFLHGKSLWHHSFLCGGILQVPGTLFFAV